MAGMGMGMSMSGGSGYKPQTTGGRRGGGDYYGNAASPLRGSKGASTMASSNFQASGAGAMRQPRFGSPVKEETEEGILKMINE